MVVKLSCRENKIKKKNGDKNRSVSRKKRGEGHESPSKKVPVENTRRE